MESQVELHPEPAPIEGQTTMTSSNTTGTPSAGQHDARPASITRKTMLDGVSTPTGALPESVRLQIESERKILNNVMSICLTSDGLVIKDEDRLDHAEISTLSGVYCEGVQYYDLQGIQFINSTGMAILIDLLKALLEMGVEVQFVNVHDSIKRKIREFGLEKIIKC